jgi:flagellar biosynthetic protein FliR
MDAYVEGLFSTLLVSLRIGPTLMFAPPFTYLRIPATVRFLLGFSLAAWIVVARPDHVLSVALDTPTIVSAAASELLLGITFSLCLQLAFAALLMAGRTLDFQVGFGLALLADPSLRTQMPLIGTLLAYGAGAVFFLTGGPADLLAIWSASVDFIPIGQLSYQLDIARLLQFISSAFMLALGLVGLVIAILFLLDVAIAFLSRTLPQMNVLVLGFQVKALALLLTLPFVFSLTGALFLRIVRFAIDSTPQLVR